MESFEIDLLGRKYFFKTDEPEKISEYAEYMKSELNLLSEKYPKVDVQKLFVFYMLTITEKYFIEKEKNKELSEQIKNIDSSLMDITSEINL